MEWYTTLLIGIAILFALFLSGAPIFLAFLFAILTGIYFVIGPAGFPMFANSVLDTVSITSLASIPLFILMGELLFRSGTMDVLFDSIDKLVGRVRGRQYVLVIVLSAVFGALSGVAMAVAAMLGRAIMPGSRTVSTRGRVGWSPRMTAGIARCDGNGKGGVGPAPAA